MSDYQDWTLKRFAEETAGSSPAPGGGSVGAYAGALAAALSEMVANLTIGKKGFEDREAQMKALRDEAASLRKELLDDIRKDSESFNRYMEALRMPKDTEEQKAVRSEKMQEGLKAAAQVPLQAAETAVRIFPIAEAVVRDGNQNAVTDGLVSALLARSAVLGILLNVKINLASIRDEAFVNTYSTRVKQLEQTAVEGEKAVLSLSEFTSGTE